MAPILEMKRVSKDFGGLRALSELDIEIHESEILGIIGPNGAGKTTLLNVVTGFLKPTAGSIVYKEEPITNLKPFQIAEKGIVRTFQLTSLFPNLTTEENVIAGRHLKTRGNILGSILRRRSYRDGEMKLRKKATEILDFTGMLERRDSLARNLPGGDQRNLEIAIALATEPELLLLDEPAAGLNPEESVRLVSLIQSIQRMGITLAIIEHNMKVIMDVCSRIVVFDYGRKIAEGTPNEIINNDRVISVYLGTRRQNA
jgi:branched-chain amino acid transport system ATP-binding protein